MPSDGREISATDGSLSVGRDAVIRDIYFAQGPRSAEPVPGPIYSAVPALPPSYQPRTEELEKIKKLLLGSQPNVGIVGEARHTGLSGMGGLGKTLLATAIVQDSDVRAFFDYGVIWLTFGQTAPPIDQLRLLSRAVTGHRADYDTVGEARADLARLLKTQRILIVLDDIWESKQVDAFNNLAPNVRLLITTRRERLLQRVDASAHKVDLLDRDLSVEFFTNLLHDQTLPPDASALIHECGGLPLALAATAAMVRRHGWERAARAFKLYRLDSFQTTWLPQDEYTNLGAVLAASVALLPDRERACFERCAVWPEDAIVLVSTQN